MCLDISFDCNFIVIVFDIINIIILLYRSTKKQTKQTKQNAIPTLLVSYTV